MDRGNILSSTGFVGRITIDLVVEEFPLNVCNAFWRPKEKRIAAFEKFKLLSNDAEKPSHLWLGFSASLDKKVIEEMEEKRMRLKVPRQFSIRSVLIHVNGIEDSVLDERYFDKVIDLSELLVSV